VRLELRQQQRQMAVLIDELLSQRGQSRRLSRGERASRQRAKRSAAGDASRGKREQAAKEVSQPLRDIFRKLVSALHPDREPDPTQRTRKNQLMQRVNQAYEANDLLTLLGLQLEIEQIDAAHLSSTTAKRLAHYNQILSEQLARLEAELESSIEPYRDLLGRWSGQALTVAEVDRKLTMDVAQLRDAVRQLTQDLMAFRDPARLRARLRQYDLDDEPGELEAMQEMMEIATMLGDFRPPRVAALAPGRSGPVTSPPLHTPCFGLRARHPIVVLTGPPRHTAPSGP
jgi:hypothetical protein